jgi:hypothetical protein
MNIIFLADGTNTSGGGGGGTALLLIAVVLYFIPSLIASSRQVRNRGSVIVINLLLGWTFIGWVVALAMACRTVDEPLPPKRLTGYSARRAAWWSGKRNPLTLDAPESPPPPDRTGWWRGEQANPDEPPPPMPPGWTP